MTFTPLSLAAPKPGDRPFSKGSTMKLLVPVKRGTEYLKHRSIKQTRTGLFVLEL